MISIIIPYVEDRGYLNEAILSVHAQTYKDFEIIKIRGNRTQGANINKGLKKAKGEFIKILHDDDILPPNSLEDLNIGADFVCGDMLTFGEAMYCDPKIYTGCVPELSEMVKENQIYGGTTLYKTDVLLRAGGYDESLPTGEEYELYLRLLKMGIKCTYVPRVVHHYRLWEHNKSYDMGPGEKLKRREFIKQIASWYQ